MVGIGNFCIGNEVVDTPVAEESFHDVVVALRVVGVGLCRTAENSQVGVDFQVFKLDAHHHRGSQRVPLDTAFSFPRVGLLAGLDFVNGQLVFTDGDNLSGEVFGRQCGGSLVLYLQHVRTLEILARHGLHNGKVNHIEAVVMIGNGVEVRTDGLDAEHQVVPLGHLLRNHFPTDGIGQFARTFNQLGIDGFHLQDGLFVYHILAVEELHLIVEVQGVGLLSFTAQVPHFIPSDSDVAAQELLAGSNVYKGGRSDFRVAEVVERTQVEAVLHGVLPPQGQQFHIFLIIVVLLLLFFFLFFLFRLFRFWLFFFLHFRLRLLGRLLTTDVGLELEGMIGALAIVLQHDVRERTTGIGDGRHLCQVGLVAVEVGGNYLGRDDTHVGQEVLCLINHRIAVHGHIGLLAGIQFHDLEVIRIGGCCPTGNDGHGPGELGIQWVHLCHGTFAHGIHHGGEKLGSLCFVAHLEGAPSALGIAHYDGSRQFRIVPPIGRHLGTVSTLGQKAECPILVIGKQVSRTLDFARRNVVEQFLHLHRIERIGRIGLDDKGCLRLAMSRCGNGQVGRRNGLFQLESQMHLLHIGRGVGQCDGEILARVGQIQQHLRWKHLLGGSHCHNDLLRPRTEDTDEPCCQNGY